MGIGRTNGPGGPFVGTDGASPGRAGLVPRPSAEDGGNFLRGDGKWEQPEASKSITEEQIDAITAS